MRLPRIPLLLLILTIASPLVGMAGEGGGAFHLCQEDEYPIFAGEAGQVAVAVCLPDDPDLMGDFLSLHFRGPDGKILTLVGEIHGDDRFVVANELPLPVGGYSTLRVNRGKDSYIVYSGFGILDDDMEEGEVIAGLALERDGVLVAHYDMSETFTTELGGELFETLEMALDAYPFHPPVGGENDMRMLAEALRDRIETLREKGGRPVLRAEGGGIIEDRACRFFSLGEMKGEEFAMLEEYAIDRAGEIHVLTDARRNGFTPLQARAALTKEPAAWQGEYCNDGGCLQISDFRSGASGRDFFRFSFILDGEMVGDGHAAVEESYAGSFDLDFTLDKDRIRVSLGSPIEGGPEEEWSRRCTGVYSRQ